MGGRIVCRACETCCITSQIENKDIIAKPTLSEPEFTKMVQDITIIPLLKPPKHSQVTNISLELDKAYSELINYDTEDFTTGYEEMLKQYGCRVYAKDSIDGVIIKAD